MAGEIRLKLKRWKENTQTSSLFVSVSSSAKVTASVIKGNRKTIPMDSECRPKTVISAQKQQSFVSWLPLFKKMITPLQWRCRSLPLKPHNLFGSLVPDLGIAPVSVFLFFPFPKFPVSFYCCHPSKVLF